MAGKGGRRQESGGHLNIARWRLVLLKPPRDSALRHRPAYFPSYGLPAYFPPSRSGCLFFTIETGLILKHKCFGARAPARE